MEPMKGFAAYDCIKQVQAAEIVKVGDEGCRLRVPATEEGQPDTWVYREFKPGMTGRYKPQVGDFWLVYPPDGYESISPRATFLDGYVLTTPPEPPLDPAT